MRVAALALVAATACAAPLAKVETSDRVGGKLGLLGGLSKDGLHTSIHESAKLNIEARGLLASVAGIVDALENGDISEDISGNIKLDPQGDLQNLKAALVNADVKTKKFLSNVLGFDLIGRDLGLPDDLVNTQATNDELNSDIDDFLNDEDDEFPTDLIDNIVFDLADFVSNIGERDLDLKDALVNLETADKSLTSNNFNLHLTGLRRDLSLKDALVSAETAEKSLTSNNLNLGINDIKRELSSDDALTAAGSVSQAKLTGGFRGRLTGGLKGVLRAGLVKSLLNDAERINLTNHKRALDLKDVLVDAETPKKSLTTNALALQASELAHDLALHDTLVNADTADKSLTSNALHLKLGNL